jgi:hypothetical protein
MLVEGKQFAHRWYRGFPSELKGSLWLREGGWNSHPKEYECRTPTALGAPTHRKSLGDRLIEELRHLLCSFQRPAEVAIVLSFSALV